MNLLPLLTRDTIQCFQMLVEGVFEALGLPLILKINAHISGRGVRLLSSAFQLVMASRNNMELWSAILINVRLENQRS